MVDAKVWDSIEDLRGEAHYEELGVRKAATRAEIRRAFALEARKHHPDKGGDDERFARVRKAYEVLSDPKARETYDALMKEHQYRYIRGITPRAPGGEDVLLDDIERLGLENVCAETQLVTLCEICGRPSTRVCYACTALFCDFCERKMHWKGSVGLHWPVVRVDGKMARQLGEKQLEHKRKEDAERAMQADPNYRSDYEMQETRTFKEVAVEIHHSDGRHKTRYDIRMARHYMWAQTARNVYLAVNLPTGYSDKELYYEFNEENVLIQPEDSFPVVDRIFANAVNTKSSVKVYRTADNRFAVFVFRKAKFGEEWKRIFKGDSDFARCMKQPYEMLESNEEAVMEFEVPYWTEREDVDVEIRHKDVWVRVAGEFDIVREFWMKRQDENEKKFDPWKPISLDDCMWSLDDAKVNDAGERCKTLTIVFAKPKISKDEAKYKRGERGDNRNCYRDDARRGTRFFVDDGDAFGLEFLLQAHIFRDIGQTWKPALPAEAYYHPFSRGRYVEDLVDLSQEVRDIVSELRKKNEDVEDDEDFDEYVDV